MKPTVRARMARNPKLRRGKIPSWTVPRESADHLVCEFLESLDCARALTCWMLYKYEEHLQLVQLGCDPQLYDSAESFRPAYAATKFLSKCVGLNTGIDLKEVAIRSAEEAERVCSQTNQTIREIREGRASDLHGPVIFQAMQIISKILGPCPSSFKDVGWSPGRSTSAWGKHVTGYHKYRSRPDVTVRASTRALRALRESPWWGASVLDADAPVSVLRRALTTVGGNTLLTVPKSAKTDRVICFEPHMNIRLQLQVGGFIRSRLKFHGVDLDDQSINRRRAKLASRTGHLATIDLSMASDTIATELVYELLPIDWACLLDDLRSPYTFWPDGSSRKNEKFSSMGNGYTFELESLIFFALCKAVSSNVSVYGDDLVVPTESYSRVLRILAACGFSPNRSKSFGTGYFRESCGGDYFGGVDCTPAFLRSIPKTVSDVVKLHNQVRRFYSVFPDRRFAVILATWRTRYPHHLGPEGFGDGHYHSNLDEATPRCARHWDPERKSFTASPTWIEGWIYRTRVPYMVRAEELEHFAPALCEATGPKRPLDLLSAALKQVVKYRDIWGLANVWPDVLWV